LRETPPRAAPARRRIGGLAFVAVVLGESLQVAGDLPEKPLPTLQRNDAHERSPET